MAVLHGGVALRGRQAAEELIHLSGGQGRPPSVAQADGRLGFMYHFPEPVVFRPALAEGAVYAGTSGGLLIYAPTLY